MSLGNLERLWDIHVSLYPRWLSDAETPIAQASSSQVGGNNDFNTARKTQWNAQADFDNYIETSSESHQRTEHLLGIPYSYHSRTILRRECFSTDSAVSQGRYDRARTNYYTYTHLSPFLPIGAQASGGYFNDTLRALSGTYHACSTHEICSTVWCAASEIGSILRNRWLPTFRGILFIWASRDIRNLLGRIFIQPAKFCKLLWSRLNKPTGFDVIAMFYVSWYHNHRAAIAEKRSNRYPFYFFDIDD